MLLARRILRRVPSAAGSTLNVALSLLPPRLEELPQQRRRLRLAQAAVDVRRVMAGGLGEEARAMVDPAPLRVGSRVIEATQSGERDGGRAHRTGLQRHVEIAVDEPFGADRGAGGSDRQDLGMGRRIAIDERAVAGGREDRAVPDDHGPDRHLAARCSSTGFGKGFAQGVSPIRNPQRTLPFRAPSCYHAEMTDTTEPPDRPKSPRSPHPYARKDETLARTGDKPRSRPGGKRDDSRSGRSSPRHAEPAPREDDARIAKVMARAGLCSRRDAESWIAAGRVAVNGAVIDSPALNVKAEDVITVDGMPLPDREPTRLFMFHKPRGLVTTSRDPEGRPTIFENLPEGLPRVVSVGRLDINTEGLMLLTNDGGLARVLELPATGWLRRYRVRANGEIDQARLDTLKSRHHDRRRRLCRVSRRRWIASRAAMPGSPWDCARGRTARSSACSKRWGLAVTRLIRISFGPFQLGDLAEGGGGIRAGARAA